MSGTHSEESIVVLEGVNKWFGELHVLKDINVTVSRGEVVVVIGPSGSGKSTLCRAINRLETIDQGSITLDGTPLPRSAWSYSAADGTLDATFATTRGALAVAACGATATAADGLPATGPASGAAALGAVVLLGAAVLRRRSR